MPRTVYRHYTILFPRADQSSVDTGRDLVKKLTEEHPEWKDLQWSFKLYDLHDGRDAVEITVVDPRAWDYKDWLFWIGVWVILIAFFFEVVLEPVTEMFFG